MKKKSTYTLIDGIKCYSPNVAHSYKDYPSDGFELTDENTENSFWVQSRNRLFKYLILKNLHTDKLVRFLEIGCGTGDFISKILDEKRLNIIGSEIYINGLKYAKKNLPNIDFIQLDITDNSLHDVFNMIAIFDVIEHIEDDTLAIKNINNLLSENGIVIISVPQHKFMWSKLDDIVKHKRRYSKNELIQKLKLNGFSIEYSTSFVFTLFPIMFISRILENKQGRSKSDKIELEKKVKFSKTSNIILGIFMRLDEALIKFGFSLPFGGTLVIVARKNGI